MNRVAVVGSINMDLVVQCERLPNAGETVLAKRALEIPGGKGANQAVAASRLGAQTVMLGRVGSDAFSGRLRDGLEQSGVDCEFVRSVEGQQSGLAVIGVDGAGENSIMVAPGANSNLAVGNVAEFREEIAAADILALQLEVPLAVVKAAIECAREVGTLVLLDPAPPPIGSFEFLWQSNILCPNRAEASMLLGQPVRNAAEAEMAARQMCRMGVEHAVITLGDQGVVYCSGDTVLFIDAFEIQAVDTTAAGDAFAGALASCWGNVSVSEALRYASAAGALAAAKPGAQPSLPTRPEIEAFFRKSS